MKKNYCWTDSATKYKYIPWFMWSNVFYLTSVSFISHCHTCVLHKSFVSACSRDIPYMCFCGKRIFIRLATQLLHLLLLLQNMYTVCLHVCLYIYLRLILYRIIYFLYPWNNFLFCELWEYPRPYQLWEMHTIRH